MAPRLRSVPIVLASALLLSSCGAATAVPGEPGVGSGPAPSSTTNASAPADDDPAAEGPESEARTTTPPPSDPPLEAFPLTVGGPVPYPSIDAPGLSRTPDTPAATPAPGIPDPIRSTPIKRAETMEPPHGVETEMAWVPPHWSDPDTQERGWVGPAFVYAFELDTPGMRVEGYDEEFERNLQVSFSVNYVGDFSDIREGISLPAEDDPSLEQTVTEVAGYPAVLTVPTGGGAGLYRIEMALHGELIAVNSYGLVIDGEFYGLDAEQLTDMTAQYLETLYGEAL